MYNKKDLQAAYEAHMTKLLSEHGLTPARIAAVQKAGQKVIDHAKDEMDEKEFEITKRILSMTIVNAATVASLPAIERALLEKLNNANWESVVVTMKCDGETLTIRPCTGAPGPANQANCEYFLVHSNKLPYMGGETLTDIARQIQTYPVQIVEKELDEYKLAKCEKQLTSGKLSRSDWEECYDFYSDYYKDVYGHRPRHITRPSQFPEY